MSFDSRENLKAYETAETSEASISQVPESDTREKLEADIYDYLDKTLEGWNNEAEFYPEPVCTWLDRQAAITEQECLVQSVQGADAILTVENVKLLQKVKWLETERAEYRRLIRDMYHALVKTSSGFDWVVHGEGEEWKNRMAELGIDAE